MEDYDVENEKGEEQVDFEQIQDAVAGVDLCGWRQKDGSVILGSREEGEPVKGYPKSIKLPNGTVYTLEFISRSEDNNFENAGYA